MALTDDDKKAILELCARGYSHRRIADMRGHSETTIRNVIKDARREVIKLKDDDLQVEQIASQLYYPLAFVSRTLRKYEEKRRENIKVATELEAEGEVSESSHRPNIESSWQDFETRQQLSSAMELLQERAGYLIDELEQLDGKVQSAGLVDKDWCRCKKPLEVALDGFIIPQMAALDSVDELTVLERVVMGIEEKFRDLSAVYQRKISEAAETHRKEKVIERQEAKEESDQLIDKKTKNVPLFPEFVRTEIKRLIIVRNDDEASIVAHAMYLHSQYVPQIDQKSLEYIKQFWLMFVEAVRQHRWKYLHEKEQRYWIEMEKAFIPMGVCPHCSNQLNTGHKHEGILYCRSCDKLYRLPS